MEGTTVDRRQRVALLLVQLGAVAVVLAALPYKSFDLDRFFVPKELVLHLTAAGAALWCLRSRPALSLSAADRWLATYLALSTVSALFATNWWLAERAVAISWSGALLFWVGAAIRRDGGQRGLIAAVAIAVIVGAMTALVQAYGGPTTDLFSLNRAPGGTFGNRNFMAHLAAIGTPAVVIAALSARSRAGFALGTVGSVVLAGALVLSRSRAAWLALAAAAVAIAGIAILTRASISGGRTWRRLAVLGAAAALGSAGAAFLPNRLEWKSNSPYLDSVVGVVNFREGSGAGRLVQYRTSLRMAMAHPLLGAGPGNWSVAYPRFATPDDPSLSNDEGMTDNPWPSSDWVAFVSERGLVATVCLAFALLALVGRSIRDLRRASAAGDSARATSDLMLIGTVVAAVVVGLFDAVLLIAAPTFVLWLMAGVLAPPAESGRMVTSGRWPLVVVAAVSGLALLRSATQWAAIATYDNTTSLTRIEAAESLDPGAYRIRMRLADAYASRGNCTKAVPQARAARGLFPNAGGPKAVLRRCGVR